MVTTTRKKLNPTTKLKKTNTSTVKKKAAVKEQIIAYKIPELTKEDIMACCGYNYGKVAIVIATPEREKVGYRTVVTLMPMLTGCGVGQMYGVLGFSNLKADLQHNLLKIEEIKKEALKHGYGSIIATLGSPYWTSHDQLLKDIGFVVINEYYNNAHGGKKSNYKQRMYSLTID
jgi:hypothetical protein